MSVDLVTTTGLGDVGTPPLPQRDHEDRHGGGGCVHDAAAGPDAHGSLCGAATALLRQRIAVIVAEDLSGGLAAGLVDDYDAALLPRLAWAPRLAMPSLARSALGHRFG